VSSTVERLERSLNFIHLTLILTSPTLEEEAYVEIASKPRVQAYIEKCQKLADESVTERVC
jgi:hypothetical protein